MSQCENQDCFFSNGDATCNAYINVRDIGRLSDEKNEIESLWRRFRHLAEPNFLDNAKHSLYSALWEMELWEVLVAMEFSVDRSGSAGPDFEVSKNGELVLVEATVPTQGTGPDRVPEHRNVTETGIATRVPEDEIALRFLQAVTDKWDQFANALKNWNEFNETPYVIAINSCAIPDACTPVSRDLPYIVKALFSIGSLKVSIDPISGDFGEARYDTREFIRKKSGSTVNTGVFLNPAYSMISAILYAHNTLITRSSEPAQELILIHNPYARNPLSHGFLGKGREYWVEDEELHHCDHKTHE